MWKTCMVPLCTNNTTRTPNKIFIRVPNTYEIRKAWFEAVNRKVNDVKTRTSTFCCEDHFELAQDAANWEEHLRTQRSIKIKNNVVPRLNKNKRSFEYVEEIDVGTNKGNLKVKFQIKRGKNIDTTFKTDADSSTDNSISTKMNDDNNSLVNESTSSSQTIPLKNGLVFNPTPWNRITSSSSDNDNENSLDLSTSVKSEPLDYEIDTPSCFTIIDKVSSPENITIKSEIIDEELPLEIKNEFDDNSVILSTETVIIKEELNIEEILYDESSLQNYDVNPEIDPLDFPTTSNHLETNNTLEYNCKICLQNFSKTEELDQHSLIMHRPLSLSTTGPFCCKCNKLFTEQKYMYHPCIDKKKKSFECKICNQIFTTSGLLRIHLSTNHRPVIAHESLDPSEDFTVKKIFCRICNGAFPLKQALINHLTVMHRPYTLNGHGAYCTRCQTWFNEQCFKDHRPCIKPFINIPPIIISCNICYAEFKMATLLKTHLYVIHRPLTLQYCLDAFCDKCNRWFKEENYLMHKCFRSYKPAAISPPNTTIKKICTPYICAICSKEFENEINIKKHLYNIHRPTTAIMEDSGKVFCDFCKSYFDEDKFEMHLPCHSVDSKCLFCLMVMPSKDHYLLHHLKWLNWRNYQCTLCNLSTEYMRLAYLNKHMIYHGKVGIFGCMKCKIDFVNTDSLETHIKSVHNDCRCNEEPCICSIYNYDYYYDELIKHRNQLDIGGNKILLENEINRIRVEKYNAIESNIDVYFMKKGYIQKEKSIDLKELLSPNQFISQEEQNNSSYLLSTTKNNNNNNNSSNDLSMPSTSSQTVIIKKYSRNVSHFRNSTRNNFNTIKPKKIESLKTIDYQGSPNEGKCINVVIQRGRIGFGFTLVGEYPCKLDNVIPQSPADLAGLRNEDSVVEVNDRNVLTLTHDTVVDLIKKCTTNLYMKISLKLPEVEKKITQIKQCNICSLKTKNLGKHLIDCHRPSPTVISSKNKCFTCDRAFFTSKDLNEHFIKTHGPSLRSQEIGEVEKTAESFYCSKCDKNFIEYLKYLYHDPCAVYGIYRCTICYLKKPTLAHYELHNLLYRNHQYVCTICSPLDRITLSLNAMNEHRKTGHGKIGVFECLKCKMVFSSSDHAEDHQMQHFTNNDFMDPEIYKLTEVPNFYECNICKKPLYNAKKLEIHAKTHERKHLCSICGNLFANITKLNEHILVHKIEENFACHICDVKFARKKNLLLHLKAHDVKKKIICDECGHAFTHKTSLIYHMASHTNEEIFRCSVCGIKFDKQSTLSAHMELHNRENTNPHKCNICDKYFTHKCKLLVHLRLHRSNVDANGSKVEEIILNEEEILIEDSEDEHMNTTTATTTQPITIRKSKRKRKQKHTYIACNEEEEEDITYVACNEEDINKPKKKQRNIRTN